VTLALSHGCLALGRALAGWWQWQVDLASLVSATVQNLAVSQRPWRYLPWPFVERRGGKPLEGEERGKYTARSAGEKQKT